MSGYKGQDGVSVMKVAAEGMAGFTSLPDLVSLPTHTQTNISCLAVCVPRDEFVVFCFHYFGL